MLTAAETITRATRISAIAKQPYVLLHIPPYCRCVIVEKESQTLFLYRNTPNGFELEKTFACSTGAQGREKVTQGDEKKLTGSICRAES